MYFSKLTLQNIKDIENGCLNFSTGDLSVKKWNFISYDNNPKATLLLQLAAISLSGTRHLSYFVKNPGSLLMDKECKGFIEPVFLRHPLKEKIYNLCSSFGTRYTFYRKPPIEFLKKNSLDKKENVYFVRNLKFGSGNINWFSCGFGPTPFLDYKKGSLGFNTTRHRARRFISLNAY